MLKRKKETSIDFMYAESKTIESGCYKWDTWGTFRSIIKMKWMDERTNERMIKCKWKRWFTTNCIHLLWNTNISYFVKRYNLKMQFNRITQVHFSAINASISSVSVKLTLKLASLSHWIGWPNNIYLPNWNRRWASYVMFNAQIGHKVHVHTAQCIHIQFIDHHNIECQKLLPFRCL